MTMEELRKIQIEILDYIDGLCCKNNIDYYLAYGTALGAVRHHGFIPWDDDIDIIFTREGYNRLLNVFQKNENGIYKLLSIQTDRKYSYPIAKVVDTRTYLKREQYRYTADLGAYVDVFVLDSIAPIHKLAVLQKIICRFLQNGWVYSEHKYNIGKSKIKRIKISIYRLIPARCYSVLLHAVASAFRKNKTGEVCSLAFNTYGYTEESYTKKMIGDGTRKIAFENREYPVFQDVEKYLHQLYGDYMTPPPIEKRTCPHDNNVIYK